MKDHIGTPINVGNFIAYTGSGNMAQLRVGKVIEIVDHQGRYANAPRPKIKVRGLNITQDWKTGAIVKMEVGRPGILGYTSNVIVLNEDNLTEEIIDLFK